VHCRISFDMFTAKGIKNFMSFLEDASDLVASYGGSFSAEHGDGQSKAMFLPKMYGSELVQAFREFKSIWDPGWKMNPGKVVDPYRPDENLRLGPAYRPWSPDTHFSYPSDQNAMHMATLRCVGVGRCRRTHDAFMCPSFMVTREEKDTTRGRAHLLFEMFHGGLIKDGWKSTEVLESLELCLACKGCKKDCPVNVDMATYKAEFMSHHYKGKLRPRSAYAMGLVGYWLALGAKAPRISNFLGRREPFAGLIKDIAGITRQRPMPVLAGETFTGWFRRREYTGESENKVVLYPDVFNDYFYPGVLKEAVSVLERWGYQVLIPKGRPPAVRPAIDYGFLPHAKKMLRRVLNMLHPFIEKGLPVVIMEPSVAAVFKDELTSLLPGELDGKRLSGLVYMLGDLALERGLTLPRLGGKAILHGHCHQKAVLKFSSVKEMLKRMCLEVQEPQPGCCGMAGSFGFEAKHYGFSMKIGEQGLLPAVREASRGTYIVADGFSCRTQIMDGTGRMPLHTSELISLGFKRQAVGRGAEGETAPEEVRKAA